MLLVERLLELGHGLRVPFLLLQAGTEVGHAITTAAAEAAAAAAAITTTTTTVAAAATTVAAATAAAAVAATAATAGITVGSTVRCELVIDEGERRGLALERKWCRQIRKKSNIPITTAGMAATAAAIAIITTTAVSTAAAAATGAAVAATTVGRHDRDWDYERVEIVLGMLMTRKLVFRDRDAAKPKRISALMGWLDGKPIMARGIEASE
jgi:hypothetical protein